ncbi:hypothetical protein R6Q59_008551 [Mikania micrantha]|uniref:Uncharacterized protein n=1 Tax=Mikania micrantha TaxID=192012 RepID=A0A5N6Q550_9ASTR|nr:hypothetical protein E3N88_02865 [Mikania micrantha]
MDAHPTPFPGKRAQSVKSKYKKPSEPPKQKIKEAATKMHRRTFGTIRDPNVPEKTVTQKPKAKPSNQISSFKQPKTDPEFVPVPKAESAKTSPQNGTNDTTKKKKKKVVSFPENNVGYVTDKSPAREGDGVKTPVRPPFSVKAARIPGTPYLSAEKCSCCRFDRLETSSYWLGQIKSAEAVGKHFVSAAFFRLAHDCKAEPARNLHTELKKYLKRHDKLANETEWEHVSGIYGILKYVEHETKSSEDTMNVPSVSKFGDDEEHRVT